MAQPEKKRKPDRDIQEPKTPTDNTKINSFKYLDDLVETNGTEIRFANDTDIQIVQHKTKLVRIKHKTFL